MIEQCIERNDDRTFKKVLEVARQYNKRRVKLPTNDVKAFDGRPID